MASQELCDAGRYNLRMAADSIINYDYHLPAELIAAVPLPQRDASRMLCLERLSGRVEHRQFIDLPELLRPNDLLVLNQTRVIPARLVGKRAATGGRWEGLFLGSTAEGVWRLIGQTRGKLRSGEVLTIPPAADATPGIPSDTLDLELIDSDQNGEWHARPLRGGSPFDLLEIYGTVPLPPYIERNKPTRDDKDRYQTTYARIPGAVAAPTAGLHFTPQVLKQCCERGARVAFVTLHVGLGTFRPISVDNLADHVMHQEWCELPQTCVDAILATREAGGRVIAVGTTTVRTLESVGGCGSLAAWRGNTDLFIRPPYEFRVVDAILTNFHLPKSTLLVLMSAFAGREQVIAAYEAAIKERYRFFSYGDAMFIS